MGYLLPWGQMSYWGAQVIVNLFSAVPFIGPDLALLIRGDYVVGDATLNRFFSFHVIAVPLVLLGLVVGAPDRAARGRLEQPGRRRDQGARRTPTATRSTASRSTRTTRCTTSSRVSVFLFIFSAVLFFAPEGGGYFLEYNNFIEANPLKTPAHIAPVWYFTPYYSMLRATTDLMVNVLAVILAIAAVLAHPARRLPRRPARSRIAVAAIVAVVSC